MHQKFLRRILNIRWESLTPNTSVLERAGISSVEKIIMKNQLRWAGHLVRMDDERLPKRLFYGEFSAGKRPKNRPKKRFKDCIKSNLKVGKIDTNNWEEVASDRFQWRASVRSACDSFEAERTANALIKRAIRKGDIDRIPVDLRQQHVCDICGKIAMSKVGLASHKRSHVTQVDARELTCDRCNKICRSKAGLKSHIQSLIF